MIGSERTTRVFIEQLAVRVLLYPLLGYQRNDVYNSQEYKTIVIIQQIEKQIRHTQTHKERTLLEVMNHK